MDGDRGMHEDPAVLPQQPRRRRVLRSATLSLALIGSLVVGASADSIATEGEGAATLLGATVDEEGQPLRLISIDVWSDEGNEWSTVTDDAGSFELTGVDANVQLRVSLQDDKWGQYAYTQLTVPALTPSEQRDLGTIVLDDGMHSRRSPHALDVTDRSVVMTSWREVLVPAVRNPTSPRIHGCDVASQSKSALKKVRRAVNWYRSMAGLDPVTFDSRLNLLAQRSSVIQNYLRTGEVLSHNPPRSTRCWTKAGANAAGSSNLAFGANGGSAVSLYMSDFGVPSVGHRMWVLDPTAARFGSGDAGQYHSLFVFGPSNDDASQPPWVTWPSAGYFPYRETPWTWSLRTPRQDVDLSRARVSLTVSSGQQIRAVRLSRETDILIWDLSKLPKVPQRRPTRVTVAIENIRWRGVVQPPMGYTVRIVR